MRDLFLAQSFAVSFVPEFAQYVDIRDADAGMDARPLGFGQRLAAGFDVDRNGARQGADRGSFNFLRDQPNSLEIFGRRRGIAGLDDVDLEPRQLPGDGQLLAASEAGSGRLLAISQGRVKDRYFFGHWDSCNSS